MMRTLYFLILLTFVSCAEDNQVDEIRCEECADMNLVDTLSSSYLRVTNYLDTIWVTYLDSANDTSTDYRICDKESLLDVEHTKIIKANGYLYEACDTAIGELLLRVEHVSVIETCLPEFDTLQKESDLLGKWYFYQITTEEGSFTPPCEASEAYLSIEEDSSFMFGGSAGTNGFDCNVLEVKSNIIELSSCATTLAFPPTEAGVDFEAAVANLFSFNNSGALISYGITNNFLTLQNIDNQSTAKLFKP